MFRIPLLQRYLLREILRTFLFILSGITVLLVVFGLFQQATDRGLSAADVFRILPYLVPSMLPFTIPAALLLTLSVVYGKFSGDQEVVAAKAAGIHPLSLIWPALFLGGIFSVCSLLLTDQVIPWSLLKIEQHIAAVMEDLFLERLRTELQFSDPQHGLHITVTGVSDRTLQHPVIRYVKHRRPVTLRAEEAQIRLDLESREAVVKLKNIFVDLGSAGSTYVHGERVERIRWDSGSNRKVARQLPIQQLQQESGELLRQEETERQRRLLAAGMALGFADFRVLKMVGRNDTPVPVLHDRLYRLQTEVHSRYAMACSCFFFAMLGTPFAMLFGRSQFLTSFLLCFLPIVAGYYPLMLGLMTQCKMGKLDPTWGMWIGNLLLTVAAWIVARRVIRF